MIQELESGPFLRTGVPALQHQPVDAVGQRMIQRFWHTVALIHLLDHFAAVHACIKENTTINMIKQD